MSLVSVIIPAFRAENFIDAALHSVRTQTHSDLEIIVIDDASPDTTAARVAIHAAADPRVRLLRLAHNVGQSAAANHGLAHARGDFIKFFDADDLLSPHSVAAQLDALRDNPRHLAYGVWGRFVRDPAETVFTPHPGWHDSDAPVDWILETWSDQEPMYQCGLFLIPRTLLAEVGGWDLRLSLINDFEFFVRLVTASSGLRFTPRAQLRYRSAMPGSLSARTSRAACESARLSVTLGVARLLSFENSPRSRQSAADILQELVFTFHVAYPELMKPVEAEIARLGGSTHLPRGSLVFRAVCRLFGWRVALRLRQARATPAGQPSP